jgi:hypothetical protein
MVTHRVGQGQGEVGLFYDVNDRDDPIGGWRNSPVASRH